MNIIKKILLLTLCIISISSFTIIATNSNSDNNGIVKEEFSFQAEVSRLMDIIINSLYTSKEIFLRELISNASDALDKIRFLSIQDSDILGDTKDLDIRISFNKEDNTLSIRDKGIGMTKQNLIDNLGIVANSDTAKFIDSFMASKDSGDQNDLIGQFGVGFYSVYLVADKVVVYSKNNDDDQYIWESTADSTFTVEKDPRGNTLGRGTEVVLHLKEDAEEFLNTNELEKLVDKYSKFINFPIYLLKKEKVEKEVPIDDEDEQEPEEPKELNDDDDVTDEDAEEKPTTKTITEEVETWTILNEQKAIWTRSPNEIEDEEYEKFYTTLTKGSEPALSKVHFKAEGDIAFKSILYIPSSAPHDFYENYYGKSKDLKLYVRRVLIAEEFENLIPKYLSFVQGVVDSDDLPLTVSRETLQESRIIEIIKRKLTRKTLGMLRKLAEQDLASREEPEEDEEVAEGEEEEEVAPKVDGPTAYQKFFKHYGKSIKLGVVEEQDKGNQKRLIKLLRFYTSNDETSYVSLDEYISRMPETQNYIYYLTGESINAIKTSPFLEGIVSRGYEVLYLIDPLDEYLLQQVPSYDDVELVSASKEGLKFGDEEDANDAAKVKALTNKYQGFLDWLKDTLGSKVESVIVSNRIVTSPCIIATGKFGWSPNMLRINRAQAFVDDEKLKYMMAKKILEINTRHPVIRQLIEKSEVEPDSVELKNVAQLMFDSAVLQSGFPLDDIVEFQSRVESVLRSNLDVDPEFGLHPEEELEFEEEEFDEEEEEEDEIVEEEESKDEL